MRALLIGIYCQYHYVNLLIIVYPSNYCLKNRLKVNFEGMGNKPLNLNNIYHKLGPESLRRFSYFTQWLSSRHNIVYDGISKDELSAERLIHKYLKTFKKSTQYHDTLKAYHFILDDRRSINTGKFRSVRLALCSGQAA